MNVYVLYDSEAKTFMSGSMGYGKGKVLPEDAKIYKRKGNAINAASLHNVSRDVPPGMIANHKYSKRPKVVVHEYDSKYNLIAIHHAAPAWIAI